MARQVFSKGVGNQGDGRLGADAPTALSSPTAIEPAAQSRPSGLQSHGADYRGWHVRPGRWPEPAWMAEHPNYDASWEGEEDGWVDNGLKADAPTYEVLCEEIDIIEEERGA